MSACVCVCVRVCVRAWVGGCAHCGMDVCVIQIMKSVIWSNQKRNADRKHRGSTAFVLHGHHPSGGVPVKRMTGLCFPGYFVWFEFSGKQIHFPDVCLSLQSVTATILKRNYITIHAHGDSFHSACCQPAQSVNLYTWRHVSRGGKH
jgi:hypothetical protein